MRKHNPWIGALWLSGITLIVVAFFAQMWLVTFYFQTADYSVTPGPFIRFLQQLADATITPALYVGFGTVGGLLFLHARNHSRRNRRPAP